MLSDLARKSPNASQNNEEGKNVKDLSIDKKESIFYKYSKGIPLAECILIGGSLPMFLQISDGKAILHERIDLDTHVILPLDKTDYLSKEYSFSSIDEINFYIKRATKESLDSLFKKTRNIWGKYFDADKSTLDLCTADTIFTYFQDKLGMTHYLFFVGDNNTGKSNALSVLEQLAYRPLKDVNISPANIYNFLGQSEEGQGIILEDEIDDIEEQQEKMKIYKSGYTMGSKVTRMYDSPIAGRKPRPQNRFNTYCFKAFTSEKQPGFYKGKGFIERIFPIHCSTGNPQYDILEVVNDAGDVKYKKLVRELEDLRKLLLIYRLIHHNDSIPDLDLSIKNREKQLCKPLIRLFQDANALKDILKSLSQFIAEKRSRKLNSLDSFIYSVVGDLVKESNGYKISNEEIWEVVCTLPGNTIPTKPQSYQADEFGILSKTMISRICEDKFGAKREHDGKHRVLAFNKEGLKRLAQNYSPIKQIEIIHMHGSNRNNTFNTFWNNIENKNVGKSISSKNHRSKTNLNLIDSNGIVDSPLENVRNVSIHPEDKNSRDPDKVLKPLEALSSDITNNEKGSKSDYLLYFSSQKESLEEQLHNGFENNPTVGYKKPFYFCKEHPVVKNIHFKEIVDHIKLSDLHKATKK